MNEILNAISKLTSSSSNESIAELDKAMQDNPLLLGDYTRVAVHLMACVANRNYADAECEFYNKENE